MQARLPEVQPWPEGYRSRFPADHRVSGPPTVPAEIAAGSVEKQADMRSMQHDDAPCDRRTLDCRQYSAAHSVGYCTFPVLPVIALEQQMSLAAY